MTIDKIKEVKPQKGATQEQDLAEKVKDLPVTNDQPLAGRMQHDRN